MGWYGGIVMVLPLLVEGQFLLRDPLLRALVLTGTVQSLLGPALLGVGLPVYVLRLFGTPVNLGLLLAAYTTGAIASGALYAVLAPALPRRPILVRTVLVMTLGVGLLALTPPLWLMLLALVLLGLEQGPGPALFNALTSPVSRPADRRTRGFRLAGERCSARVIRPPAGADGARRQPRRAADHPATPAPTSPSHQPASSAGSPAPPPGCSQAYRVVPSSSPPRAV